jgi:hypothetical protein
MKVLFISASKHSPFLAVNVKTSIQLAPNSPEIRSNLVRLGVFPLEKLVYYQKLSDLY